MLLEANNLSYSREHKQVLNEVNMHLMPGKITAILGENGSGKSTLLRLLAGHLDPESGQITLGGEPVLGPNFRLIPGHPKISLVKQDNKLLPFHTVRQNIKHVLQFYPKKQQEDKIEELSTLLGLHEKLDRPLKYLSGGEQQRVSIAASLAANPSFLLMDEPFSQTDMYLKQRLTEHLKQVVDKLEIGLSFATHHAEDALGLSDNILILDNGRIIEEGPGKNLYYYPKCRTTAILTGYCNWLPVSKFPQLCHLHKLNKEFLVRPDRVTVAREKRSDALGATVKKVEFRGFYRLLHLTLEGIDAPILASQIDAPSSWEKGQQVWVLFDEEKIVL